MKIKYRKRSTPFIKRFDATPEGIVCPHFWMLSHSNGCLYNCAYCYLKHTMRNNLIDGRVVPTVFTNLDDMKGQLIEWAEENKEPCLLNTGELSDSFLDTGYMPVLFNLAAFSKPFKRHTILLLTKGADNVLYALRSLPTLSNTVISFSVSTNAGMYEMGAPPVLDRLKTARTLKDAGWRIRLRIDPLIPQRLTGIAVDNEEVIRAVVAVSPELVTLGSLRFSWGWQYNNMLKGATSESDGCGRNGGAFKMRLPASKRIAMYEDVIAALRTYGYEGNIGLCKETIEVMRHFGLDEEPVFCNCTVRYE